jgi:bacteriocin-like protein
MSENKSIEKTRELTEAELNQVSGGKQKPDGTAAGNVAAKWSVAQGAVA